MGNPLDVLKNRIIGYGEEDLDQILFNPDNFRLHPKKQQNALLKLFKKIGIVQNVIVNKRTGMLIDGHLRCQLAARQGQKKIPVTYVDLDKDEEILMLTTLDEIARQAEVDPDKLGDNIDDIRGSGILEDGVDDVIEDVLQDMMDEYKVLDGKEVKSFDEISSDLPGVQALKDFMVFDSDLPFGMPKLLEDKILTLPEKTEVWIGNRGVYDDPDCYLYVWGSDSIKGLDLSKTVVCFYTDDRRFESFWYDPAGYTAKLLNSGVKGVFMPNFSMFPEAPEALLIWQRYRSLWLARYFQEAGLDVLPDLRTMSTYGVFNNIGIPDGVPCAAQYQQGSIDYTKEIAYTDGLLTSMRVPRLYLYADKRGQTEFVGNSTYTGEVVWIPNRVSTIRPVMDGTKTKNPLKP